MAIAARPRLADEGQTRRGSRCRSHRARDATPPSFAMCWRLAGSGGAGQSAAPPRLDDGNASPSSRRLAAYSAALRTTLKLFPGRDTRVHLVTRISIFGG